MNEDKLPSEEEYALMANEYDKLLSNAGWQEKVADGARGNLKACNVSSSVESVNESVRNSRSNLPRNNASYANFSEQKCPVYLYGRTQELSSQLASILSLFKTLQGEAYYEKNCSTFDFVIMLTTRCLNTLKENFPIVLVAPTPQSEQGQKIATKTTLAKILKMQAVALQGAFALAEVMRGKIADNLYHILLLATLQLHAVLI